MIKCLFLMNNLGGGGAERVLVNLVNHMDDTRFDITIQTVFPAGQNKSSLSKNIKLVEGKMRECRGISRLFKYMPKRIASAFYQKDNYDIAIAYLHGVPTKILWDYNGKKIAWLHDDMEHSSLSKCFFNNQISKCFDSYDRIVGVSDTVCDSFARLYGLKEKLLTIYNTNDTKDILIKSNEEQRLFEWSSYKGTKLISIGNLREQKGYDRLIRVCKKIKNGGLDFSLLILGDGNQKEMLKKMIADNNLSETIELGGFISNPYPYIKQADLFVCSSRFEGLSTVMTESLILGTPIITTEVSGSRETLGNNEYGVIVENSEDGLYDGLKCLLENPDRIEYYREKAKERAQLFDTRATVKAVEDLIQEVVDE